jgi:hypothetical protein
MGHWWNGTDRAKPRCVDPGDRAVRVRPYWSQNRHNTADQLLPGHTSLDMCGYFSPTGLSKLLLIEVLLFLSLLIVGDVNFTLYMHLMMTGTKFC